MNITEFAALKVGDKVQNLALGGSGAGEVVETTESGVRVVWGARHDRETRFFYSGVGTAWFHWSKVEPEPLDQPSAALRPGLPVDEVKP